MNKELFKNTSEKIYIIFLIFAIILATFSACNKPDALVRESTVRIDKFKAGTLAPEIEGVDLNGLPIKLSDFRGSPVLLSFYATWCSPCLQEMPALVELQNKGIVSKLINSSIPIKVLMINTDSPNNIVDVKSIKEKYKMTMPIILDPEMISVAKYEVSGFPETFLLDHEGRFLQIDDPEKMERTTRIISTRDWLSSKMSLALSLALGTSGLSSVGSSQVLSSESH